MTQDDSILIEQFEGKIRKLADLYNIKESYQYLKQSKVLEVSGHDIDDTKRRVSGLVREIDHCIKLLNV